MSHPTTRFVGTRRAAALLAAAAAVTVAGSLALGHPVAARATVVGPAALQSAGLQGRLHTYLRVSGITSDTPAADHSTDIDVSRFSFGVKSTAPAVGSGSGGGASKPTFDTFDVSKAIDATTPKFLSYVATGKFAPTASITIVRTDSSGNQLESLVYDLTDVTVTSDQQDANGFGAGEALELDAARIKATYFTGTTSTSVFTWDRARNASF